MSEFDDALAALPSGSGAERGIIPVLVRITTHLGYLIAHITDKPVGGPPPDGSDAVAISAERAARATSDGEDIAAINLHANNLNVASDTVSRATNGQLIRLTRLIHAIGEEWPNLTDEQRVDRVTTVANRLAGIASLLDTELAGIESGPGAHV